MGTINIEGVGPIQIAGERPTPEEMQTIQGAIQRRGQADIGDPMQSRQGGEALQRAWSALPPTVRDVAQSIPTGLAQAGASIAGTAGALPQLARQAGRVVIDPVMQAVRGNPSPEDVARMDQWTRMGSFPEQAGASVQNPALRALATGNLPTPPQIMEGAQQAGLPIHEPTTGPGRYARDITEGAGAMAVGPIRALPWMIGLGAAGGGASRATEDLTASMDPNSLARRYGPETARLATTLLGGLPAASRGAAGDILERRMTGITPADTQRAQGLSAEGNRMQVPLNPGEAYGAAGGPLQDLSSDIMATPQGAPMRAAINARQPQVVNAVRGPGGILERVSSDRDPAALAAERTRQTRPLYDAADLADIPPGSLDPIVAAVDDAIARVGAHSDIGLQLGAYRRRLTTPEGPAPAPAAQGQPAPPPTPMQVGPVATLYQETRGGIPPAREPGQTTMQARTRGIMGEINPQTGQTLEAVNPDFAAAQQRFRDMSPRVDASEGAWSLEPPAQGMPPSLARMFDEALNAGSVQPRNPTVGARFANLARGREGATTRDAFDERIRQAALARGLNPDAMVADLNRSMDVLAETGSIPGIGSRTAPRGALRDEARSSRIADAASIPQTIVGRGALIDALRNWGERSAYGRLNAMLMPGADVEALNRARGAGAGARQGALAARLLSVLQAPGNVEQGR